MVLWQDFKAQLTQSLNVTTWNCWQSPGRYHKTCFRTSQISSWFRQRDKSSQTRKQRPTHLAPMSLWTEIPSNTALRFTATLDITSPTAVNKQWRYIGGWLYVSYLLIAVSATNSSHYATHHPSHRDDKTHCINKLYWFWCIAEPTACVNCTCLEKNSVGFTHLLTTVRQIYYQTFATPPFL